MRQRSATSKKGYYKLTGKSEGGEGSEKKGDMKGEKNWEQKFERRD